MTETLNPLAHSNDIRAMPPPDKNHKSTLITAGAGEIVLTIITQLNELFTEHHKSFVEIEKKIINLCKNLTGASWVEILIKQNDKLQVLGSKQIHDFLEINPSSLPGFVAEHNLSQIINNPHTSTFYSTFTEKILPFSIIDNALIEPTSLCAVPFTSGSHEVKGVIMLFDKLDQNKALSYFTMNDVHIVQSIGIVMTQIIVTQSHFSEIHRKLNVSASLREELININEVSTQIFKRMKLVKRCRELIKKDKIVNENMVTLIKDCMQAHGVILHININNDLKMRFIQGFENFSQDVHSFKTQTSFYSAFTTKKMINIQDLASEPLWEEDKPKLFRSLLSCPIINKNDYVLGVIEFFRQDKFTTLDEKIAKFLISALGKISHGKWALIWEKEKNTSQLAQEAELNRLVMSLYSFYANFDIFYDYTNLFEQAQKSLKRIISYDAIVIYIVDTSRELFWTHKSDKDEGFTLPINKENLAGLVYESKKIITLPDDDILISDHHHYSGKFVLGIPLISKILCSKIIGVAIISRSSHIFDYEETDYISCFLSNITRTLEEIHVHTLKLVHQTTEIEHESPTAYLKRMHTEKIRGDEIIRRRSSYESQDIATLWKNNIIIDLLFHIGTLSPDQLEKITDFRQIIDNDERPLHTFANNLMKVVECRAASLLLKDLTEEHLFSLPSETLVKPSGLINYCLQNGKLILYRNEAYKAMQFDGHVDSLGINENVESILCVPIYNFCNNVDGVLCFVNSPDNFPPETVTLARFLSLIPREILQTKDINIESWQNILKESRKHKMLLQWCKQIFTVGNHAQYKQILAKNIIEKLTDVTEVGILLQSILEIMCSLTNSEDSRGIFVSGGEFTVYNSRGVISHYLQDSDKEKYMKIIKKDRPLSLSKYEDRENTIYFPYSKSDKSIVIEMWNKKHETLAYYSTYTKEDEIIIKEISKVMLRVLIDENPETMLNLRQLINSHISNLNNHSLLSTIRCAAQKLLDCDRATLFLKEGKNLTAKAQGIEQEIPVDFTFPLGKGIIGNVAQTGQTENIKDVYEDSRFNKEIDELTGYRTTSMLCMPIFSLQGDVIAALQMINKNKGIFDKNDEDTLELFCKIVSTQLQSWSAFQKAIEERTDLLNILNSIGNYILVLNSQGVLSYYNKSFEDIIGVNEVTATSMHYSQWLKCNRELVIDITTIFNNPYKRIRRNSKRISVMPRIRSRTMPAVGGLSFGENKSNVFNYSLAALRNLSTKEAAGVIIVLEDASAIEELNAKFKSMQSQFLALANPIMTETSLQKCINKLSCIATEIDSASDMHIQLKDIIHTLKHGNLNHAELRIPSELNHMENELHSRLKEYIECNTIEEAKTYQIPKIPSGERIDQNGGIELENLRNWNLNAFEIDDHFTYIKNMLQDFDLLLQFGISSAKLRDFSEKVKEGYQTYKNPFHNFYHGFSVMHSTYVLLVSTNAGEVFNAHEILSHLIASLCHDIGHTGHNNSFEINQSSSLSILYNDKSVLENHHSARTFQILQNPSSNILENVPQDLQKIVRKLIIECILGTDMARHFGMISYMNTRMKDAYEHPLGTIEDDCEKLAAFLIHSADLAHPAKELSLFSKWSHLVCEEFSRQYEEEIKLDLPATEFMKGLDEPKLYYKNEIGFLTIIVKPLWECLNLWLHPRIDHCLNNLADNIKFYQKKFEELQR
ncbi:unnamed protein product [Blepharisma stoltei]|uniref:Phosphodiesterase n=1 Tax=Blepharisma stoltei TaxID=1481888 RepID=A0AAU9JCG9_9CILI|nr:unnamed protein product [Blepharisma stoltei]